MSHFGMKLAVRSLQVTNSESVSLGKGVMETIVYRQGRHPGMQPNAWAQTGEEHGKVTALAAPTTIPLRPNLFYPLLSEADLDVWSHWLPTTLAFDRTRPTCQVDIVNTLMKHHAPTEVVEEFQWSWNMEIFDTYELKTPMRRDFRDPLLIGRQGHQRYCMALWGESLRPFPEIAQLVRQSLQIRKRTAICRTWLPLGGTLTGFLLGLWLTSQGKLDGYCLDIAAAFAIQGFIYMWLPYWISSPENRQHNFLDRYRS